MDLNPIIVLPTTEEVERYTKKNLTQADLENHLDQIKSEKTDN